MLRCLDLGEEAPLPAELSVGKATYEEFKARRRTRPGTESREE